MFRRVGAKAQSLHVERTSTGSDSDVSRLPSELMALEPRVMLDGAAVGVAAASRVEGGQTFAAL